MSEHAVKSATACTLLGTTFMVRRLAASLVLSLFSLTACSESLGIQPAKGQPDMIEVNGDSNILRIRAGTSAIVEATIVRQEIEGSTGFDVHELVPDDPAVVEVVGLSDSRFEIKAVALGETILRAKNDGDERAAVPIKVVP